MKTKATIDKLWREMEQFIEAAYKCEGNETAASLRDYTTTSWHNDLEKLVSRETKNERQHRKGSPTGFVAPISARTAAMLLLMGNVAEGSKKTEMPPATIFLQFQKTAAEGITLGYLMRNVITEDWREAVAALDYADLIEESEA